MTKPLTLSITAIIVFATIGCAKEAADKTTTPDATNKPEAASNPAAATAAPPAATGGNADAYAPLSPTPELDKAIVKAKDAGDKKKLAAAYAARGDFRTNEDLKAGQRVKYRAALSDYRNALKIDKNNEQALAGKTQIEQIYTMMGRPIPSVEECDKVSETGTFKP